MLSMLAGALLVACNKSSPESGADANRLPGSLTVFYTCDTRGHIDPCGCSSGMAGGIARRKSFLDSQPRGPHLLVDAGDVTAGARAWEVLELEYLLKAYDQMGYHAVNAGQREAALGRDGLLKLKASHGNLVSANLVDENGQLLLPPYRIVNLADGSKAGIMGILDDAIPAAELGRGLKVLPPHDAISRHLPELKKQAGVIVLLAFAGEERMKEIAERFYEIHLIVGGKVLQPSATPLVANRSVIAYITDKGKAMGRLDLTANGAGRWSSTNSIVMLKEEFKDDPAMTNLIAEYKAKLKELDFIPERHHDDEEGLTLITAERSKSANKYVGAENCRSCHPKAYETWAHSKHAHAFHTLEEKGYETNPRCLECHTVGYLASDGYLNAKLTPHLKDVSCESCHGRGEHHVKFHSKQNTALKNFGFKKVVCTGCHNPDNSARFEPDSYWAKIKHGKD